ncbi:MAG: hypothetical protein J5J06_01375 [Phycisphaerae bacterium]|nr:hypothetical protein [Phycisphaerae bacterium]
MVEKAKGIPQKYHLLHRTAHVPLVVFLKLQGSFGVPLGPRKAQELQAYRQLIVSARKDLGDYRFTPDEIAWQEALLLVSSEFLEELTEDSIITTKSFADYRNRVQSPMMALADRAGEAQVESLHSAMQTFRKKLTDEEWKRLRVLIIGPRQPRQDYAATQYFAALFNESGNTPYPGESKRLFYVESPFIDRDDNSFEHERRTVASMILDRAVSEVFFDDPNRMSIDIAADGARKRVALLDFAGLRSD